MNEVYYQNAQVIVLNFSNRLAAGGKLMECEAMAYEQCCRLVESVARNLRHTWDKMNRANELKDAKEDE